MENHWIRQLATVASLAPSADNSQPWQLRWDGRSLHVSYARRQPQPDVFRADSHATLLSIGALLAHIDTALKVNRVPAAWHWPADPGAGEPYASVEIGAVSADFLPPRSAIGRHTHRLPFRADSVPAGVLDRVRGLTEDTARAVAVTDPAQKAAWGELVRRASEARFSNRALHEWLMSSLRMTPEEAARGDGLDTRTLGLPPGGLAFLQWIADWRRLAFLNRFGAYKMLARGEIALLRRAPALLMIAAPADARSTIAAGRLMAKAWMELNFRGVAVQPYYAVTDQIDRLREGTLPNGFTQAITGVSARVGELLPLAPREMLHMMMRVGYPKAPAFRSQRLPLDAVFVDDARGR